MVTYDLREGLIPKRLALTMWDFSWLYCHYKGASYEDYDKVTDELLERNFNCVRIDCFPQIIGELAHDDDEVTIPANPKANWGHSDIDVKHKIIKELIEFMEICKRKGIYVILSSWNSSCVEVPGERVINKSLEQYLANWERTINILKERDLLEHVAYVDLDQEFPYFSPFDKEIQTLAGSKNYDNPDLTAEQKGLCWNAAQRNYIKNLTAGAINQMHRNFPELRFTYSLTSFWNEMRTIGVRDFDVLELHFFVAAGGMSSSRLNTRTGFDSLLKQRGEDNDYKDYQDRVRKAFKAVRPMLLGETHNQLEFARDWGREISAPIVNTESWGPWWHMDHKDLDWNWLREWCAECNALAAKYGLWGTTPWNYGHPYWDNWKDIDWYKEVNNSFLKC